MFSRLCVLAAALVASGRSESPCECGAVSSDVYAAIENAFSKYMTATFILGGSTVSDENRADSVSAMNNLLTSNAFVGRQVDPSVQWHGISEILTTGVEWYQCGCDYSSAVSIPVLCAADDHHYKGRVHTHETWFVDGEGDDRTLVHNPAVFNFMAVVDKDSDSGKMNVRFSQITWLNLNAEFE